MINVFQPHVGKVELAAVDEVFSSNWLGTGRQVERFEEAFARYIGRPSAEVQAVSSCTEGLFHTIQALGIGRGDEVVVPTISFVGAAHAVRDTGARVVLCDVDPVTLNPSLDHVKGVLNGNTRAILLLHYGGVPGQTAEIAALANECSLLLVEDAAVSLGSSTAGRACGTLGDVGLWSFDSMKVMTTGDGGMVWSRNAAVLDRIRKSIKLGLGPTGFLQRHESSRWWEIDPPSIGRRATMNSISAAIGLAQLDRLSASIRRRHEIVVAYDAGLRDFAWIQIPPPPPAEIAQSFYWIQLKAGLRDKLARYLLEQDIYTTFKYWPLHRTHLYRSEHSFPGAETATASTLLLPLHQGLGNDDISRVLEAIESFGARVSK